ncbi:MAG: L-glutamine:scyllo-inosose aminotransferase [Planctomycetota bacterium]
MTSKKTSQAQPAEPRGLFPPQAGSESRVNARGEPDFGRFECPVWPPADPEIWSRLESLYRSGDWGRYFPEVVTELRDLIGRFLDRGATSQAQGQQVRLVCSGSAAVELALRVALQDRLPGQTHPRQVRDPAGGGELPPEVICGAFDYPGNVRAIRLLGALPVFVDTRPGGWTIDPQSVAAAATPQTAAVLVSHLYGEIADVVNLSDLCESRGWVLIEDVCQSPGAMLGGRLLGTFGKLAAWSFGGSKPLTAGCGGAVTTCDHHLAQRLATFCDRPSDAFPISPLQAAVLIPQWQRLESWVELQNARLDQLIESIAKQTPNWLWPTTSVPSERRVHYKLPIRLREGAGVDLAGLIALATHQGLPAGEPFRVPGSVAASRGRVVSAVEARSAVSQTWVLDHRVLQGDEKTIDRLAEELQRLYQRSEGSVASEP